MPHVMLRRDWNGTFSRTVHRGTKQERRITFNPGEIVDLKEQDIPDVLHDLGKALVPMEWSDQLGKFVPVDMSTIDLEDDDGPEPKEPEAEVAADGSLVVESSVVEASGGEEPPGNAALAGAVSGVMDGGVTGTAGNAGSIGGSDAVTSGVTGGDGGRTAANSSDVGANGAVSGTAEAATGQGSETEADDGTQPKGTNGKRPAKGAVKPA